MPDPLSPFEQQRANWEKKYFQYGVTSTELQTSIANLESRQQFFQLPTLPPQQLPDIMVRGVSTATMGWMRSLRERTKAAMAAPVDVAGATEIGGQRFRVQPGVTTGGFGGEVDVRSQIEAQRISNEIKATLYNLHKQVFYQEFYGSIPTLVMMGAVNSFEEALEQLDVPLDLSTDEMATLRDDISLLLSSREAPGSQQAFDEGNLGEEAYPYGDVRFPALKEPAQIPKPDTIHRITVNSLVKSLTAEKIPDSAWTTDEWKDYLSALGYSEEDIDNSVRISTEQLIGEAQNRKSQMAAWREGIAEMPDFTAMDALKQMLITPPLAVLEALGFYYEHVSMPAAGWLYGLFIPDIQAAVQQYISMHPEGGRMADAYVYAWEQWDAPGPPVFDFVLKYMLMEGLVDPLSYVGWGFVTKGLRALGPAGRLAAVGNSLAGEVLEMPFDFIKYVSRAVIPKTIGQQATVMSRQSLAMVDRYFELATGKYLSQLRPTDMYKAADDAIKHLLKNPSADDDIALAAREMLAHTPLSRTEVTSWSTRLRAQGAQTLLDTDITANVLADTNQIFEQVFTRQLRTAEAVPLLLDRLGAASLGNKPENVIALATRLLDSKVNYVFQHALDPFLEKTSHSAMRTFARNTLKIYETSLGSEVVLAAAKSGRFQSLLFNVNKKLILPWMENLNKMVIRPAAEAYLTFGLYGPMNTFEDIFRSVLGGVKPGRVTLEQYEVIMHGLLKDPETLRKGISETYGVLRDTGTPARTNWILMLSNIWLSAPTYVVTRGRITPRMFAQKQYEYMVEFFGGVGAEIRRNFVAGRYSQLLSEYGGDTFKALLEVVPRNVGPELANSPKWVRQNLLRDIRGAVLSGHLYPDNVDLITALKARYTKNKIVGEEVREIIKQYPDLSPTARSMILDGYNDGRLFAGVDGDESISNFMREVMNAEVDDFLRGPERATLQFDQLTQVLTSLEVTSPEHMSDLIVSLHRMSQTYGALPEQIIARATIKSRGLPIADRGAQFTAEMDRIYSFLDNAGADVDKVTNRLSQTLEGRDFVNNVDWSQVTFQNIPDLSMRAEIRTAIDTLPFTMKQNIKNIEINTQLVSAADKPGIKTLALWDYSTGSIVFRTAEEATPEILFHEMAHSHFLQRIDNTDMALVKEYAETFGDWRPRVETQREFVDWDVDSITTMYVERGTEHYSNFKTVHEQFSDDFESWTRYGDVRKFKEGVEAVRTTPYGIQQPSDVAARDFWDANLEKNPLRTDVIERSDAAGLLAVRLENAGDMLREMGKEFSDTGYFMEKLGRIRDSLTDSDWTRPLTTSEVAKISVIKSQVGNIPEGTKVTSEIKSMMQSLLDRDTTAVGNKLNQIEPLIKTKPSREQIPQAVLDKRNEFFKKNFPKEQRELNLPTEYVDAAQRYLNIVTQSKRVTMSAKEQDIAFRQQYFQGASQKDLRETNFWDTFYAAEDNHWRQYNSDMAKLNSQLHNAINDINAASGVKTPPRPPVKVAGRELAPQDVARLMGVQGDDISKLLLDGIIPEGDKQYFIEYIMGTVKQGYDEGFDPIGVAKVYDQIAASIQVDPMSSSWWRTRQLQLESMSDDFHTLFQSKLIPPEEKAAIDRLIDEAAEESSKLFDRVVPTMPSADVGLGERFIPPEEFDQLLEERTRQLAAQENISMEQARKLVTVPDRPNVMVDPEELVRIRAQVTELAREVKTNGDTLEDVVESWFIESKNADLQTLGRVAQGSPEYLQGIRKILNETYPEGYIRIYRGQRSKTLKPGEVLEREFTNVTSRRSTAVDFQNSWYSEAGEEIAPDIDDILIKVDDVLAIGSVVESELVIPASILKDRISNPLIPPTKIQKGMVSREDYSVMRQQALDESQKWYYKEYTDYTNANQIDAIMKNIYPFWSYESQRWFWLPRSFVRRPGTLTSWGRFEENTEFGYVHLPGTSIDVNPARGTIYGTWSTRMMRRDYPEYYDELGGFGGVVEGFDFISRYGFYPNVVYGATLALAGGTSQTLGGILPSIASTPLNWLIGTYPDNPIVSFISERVFPERFRIYLTNRRVDDFGGDGSLINAKRQQGIELTPEEQDMWTAARKDVALHSASFEQLGFARMRSDKSYELAAAATVFIEENYGFTEEQQLQMRRRNQKIWDVIGGLDPWETAMLQELEFFKYSGSINPVLPSKKQAILNRIETDWAGVMAYSENMRAEIDLLSVDFLQGSETGLLSPTGFLDRVRDLYRARQSYIDEKTKANPLMLLENRKEFYEKYGDVMPVQSPYNELMDLYFSIELEDTVDPATGERVLNWDSFNANREMITAAIPDEDKLNWETFLSRHTSPTMQMWHDVYSTYLKKYYGLWDGVLQTYSPQEQSLITTFLSLERTQQQLDRQEEIMAMESEKGGSLISGFRSAVSLEREALRFTNPYLDAWLFYWGRTTSFKSNKAEEVFKLLARQTGRRIEEM